MSRLLVISGITPLEERLAGPSSNPAGRIEPGTHEPHLPDYLAKCLPLWPKSLDEASLLVLIGIIAASIDLLAEIVRLFLLDSHFRGLAVDGPDRSVGA